MKDELYENTLKEEVDKFYTLPIEQLKAFDDYGSICKIVEDREIHIGWWKYEISKDLFHFVFKTSKKKFLIFHTPFLDGFKISYNNRLLAKVN